MNRVFKIIIIIIHPKNMKIKKKILKEENFLRMNQKNENRNFLRK